MSKHEKSRAWQNLVVSNGTHRPEDLIPAFIEALDARRELLSLRGTLGSGEFGRLDDRLGEIERRMEREDYWESDDAAWDIEWLFNELDNLAPEGTYFGAHEGDGACFGFWPVEEEDL